MQGFGSSNIIDIGWTLGYALIGLAAIGSLESATGVGTAETRMPHWNLMLPYWTVGVAGMLAVITEFTLGSLNAVLEWDLLFIITVVLVRQFLFLGETEALNTEVANKNEDLDRQVRERTRALTQSLEELYQTDDERRQLVLRLVTLQEEERRHIADVIHDDMLQSMIGAKMRTFLLHDAAGANAQATASIESAIDRAIVRMRSLMTDLRPQILDLGLLPTLEQSIAEFNEAGDLTVRLENRLADDPSQPRRDEPVPHRSRGPQQRAQARPGRDRHRVPVRWRGGGIQPQDPRRWPWVHAAEQRQVADGSPGAQFDQRARRGAGRVGPAGHRTRRGHDRRRVAAEPA